MPKVVPYFWFDGRLAEAVDLYRTLLDDAVVLSTSTRPPGLPGEPGALMSATLRLGGQEVVLFDGGPHYALSPAASLLIACDDQSEIDRIWDALCDGGTPMQCGWVTDRFGLTWQVVPADLPAWLGDPDRGRRVAEVMLGMSKLDIATLRAALEAAPS